MKLTKIPQHLVVGWLTGSRARLPKLGILVPIFVLAGCGGQAPSARPSASFPAEKNRLVLTVAVGEHPNMDVFSVSATGHALRRLIKTRAPEESATISPDGRHIAFGRDPSKGSLDAFVMRVKDRRTTRLTRTNDVMELPRGWSPDGRHLLILRGSERSGDGFTSLWVYDVGSGESRRVAASEWQIGGGAWSPDGSRIVYSEQVVDPVFNWELFTVRPDGTHRTRLTHNRKDDYMADWSPNGEQLAFVHGISDGELPPTQLWVMNADGSERRRVYVPGPELPGWEDDIWSPVWSPSGRWIAFVEKSYTMGRTSDVWKIRVSGGRPLRVTERMEVGSLDWHAG